MTRDPYKYFRPEAHDILDQFSRGILDLERGGSSAATVPHLLRLAHTLKGAARVVKQMEIANRAHAIEDALSPLRDSAVKIGPEQIKAILQHLDEINSQLASLAPGAPINVPAAKAEDAPRTIRTDVAEADAVLDGVAETLALTAGLRTAVHAVEQATQLADLLVSRFSPFAAKEHHRRSGSRSNQHYVIADQLRRKIGNIERNLGSAVDQIDRELRQLREAAERLRLVAVGNLFTALERIARDTASAMSKQVSFQATGGDIRLDLRVLEILQGALVQIIRNAVAHGIEPTGERSKAGKALVGCVSVAVFRRDRRLVFSCSDDGRGVDLEAVQRVASQRGLIASSVKDISPHDLERILLRGGISTSETVTEVSGRGIGLDVVRESVERLGGEVGFRTAPGMGTTFELIIPPSLASLDALIVEPDGSGLTIAIPLDAVRSTRRFTAAEISIAGSGASVLHDEKAIAFAPLSMILGGARWSVGRNWAVVILAGAEGTAALGVERLLGIAKIAVRPLPPFMTTSPVVLAASLDADGNPQLVVSPDSLVAMALRGCAGELDAQVPKRQILIVDDSLTTRMLEQSILESAGYEVDVAVSGEEALEKLRHTQYALILVDVEMPGMDGFTFIERIRADWKSRDIPAILVTSLVEPEHRQRGRDVGAQGYIVKSEFDQAELLSIIKPLVA
jgi:two-component system, chemotaxis family, sensor kinase CheA